MTSMRVTEQQPQSADSRLGRYEVRGLLGRGGFALVYRAWDPLLGREVALKVLLPHLAGDTDLRRRFLAEARALGRLRHPGIAVVYDVGEADGLPFFAMELVEGRTLTERISGGRTLSPAEMTAIVTPLAEAVDALHDAGLLHRDIKASNVMVEDTGRVVLMDLGIAHARDQEPTGSTALLGTPAAMAPERVRGEAAGPAADIYALGVLVFQLLAGRPPFTGEVTHVLHAHAYERPPDLRRLRPGLPENVSRAVAAALAKDPARRPARAADLAAALRGAQTGDVQAEPAEAVTRRTRRPRFAAPGRAAGGRRPARWPRPTFGRRSVIVLGGLLLALLVSFVLLRSGGGDDGALVGLPGVAVLRARAPEVADLAVYDSVFTKRHGAFQVGESVAACFTLRSGSGPEPLTAVVTRGDRPPSGENDPAVLARSDALPNKPVATCYAVRVLEPPLPPGSYRLWVLQSGAALAGDAFTALPRSGDVLLAESFDDPARGALPAGSPDPAHFALGYVDGAYQIAKVDLAFSGVPFVTLPGSYADASLAVDVRPAGVGTDRYVALGCHAATVALDSGYRVSINLDRGAFLLDRWDGGAVTSLAQSGSLPSLRRGGQANRIELTCAGGSVAVSVNGTEVARIQDGVHAGGLFWLGVESDPARRLGVDARFDNLEIIQR